MKQDKYKVINQLIDEGRLKCNIWTGQVEIMKKNGRGWMAKNTSGGGYLFITTSYHGKKWRLYCHEIIALVAGLNVLDGSERLIVNHIDGNKQHNSFFNLEMLTMSENTAHAWRTGLFKTYEAKKLREQEELI